VLGDIEERGERLYFVPAKRHPALADLDEIYCGRDGEVGTVANTSEPSGPQPSCSHC